MYVIEFFDSSANTTTYYPADNCTWRMGSSDLGYEPINVMFYPSNNTATVSLVGSAGDRITFGYIGKTGRFVAMTETNVRT